MAVVITEIALNSDGKLALEIHNNGGTAVDLSLAGFNLWFGSDGSSVWIDISSLGSIPAGGTFVIAHPDIGGDLTTADLTNLGFNYITFTLTQEFPVDDSFGTFMGATAIVENDTVYQTTQPNARFADTTVNTTLGFSNNSLGVECFLEGTQIATVDGECDVADLRPGNQVRTADGRYVSVLWVGQKWVKKGISKPTEAFQLVRIRANALGNHTDLYVTADHGMLVNGLLINASALVNGTSIEWAEYDGPYRVYHVETEGHEVLYANGALAESYSDVAGRKNFDNFQDYLDTHPGERLFPEMACTRISARRLVPMRVWAEVSGFTEVDANSKIA